MRKRHVRYSAYRYKTKYTRAKQVAKLLFMESKLRIEDLQSEIEDMQSESDCISECLIIRHRAI